MKKQSKNVISYAKTPDDKGKIDLKSCGKVSIAQKVGSPRSPKERLRSKGEICSPSNKENYHKTANQQQLETPLSPLTPIQSNSLIGPQSPSQFQPYFNSPSRTTPLESLSTLRSNKGKETIQEQPNNTLLFSGLSKDGRYRVESHSLTGQQLIKACEHERKINVVARINSRKEIINEKIPHI